MAAAAKTGPAPSFLRRRRVLRPSLHGAGPAGGAAAGTGGGGGGGGFIFFFFFFFFFFF